MTRYVATGQRLPGWDIDARLDPLSTQQFPLPAVDGGMDFGQQIRVHVHPGVLRGRGVPEPQVGVLIETVQHAPKNGLHGLEAVLAVPQPDQIKMGVAKQGKGQVSAARVSYRPASLQIHRNQG